MTDQPTPPQGPWQPSNPPAPPAPAPAQRSWFARHKILTAILALFGLGIIAGALSGGGDEKATNSAESTPSTSAAAAAVPSQSAAPAPKPTPAVSKPAPAEPKIGSKVRDGKFEFVVTKVAPGGKEIGSDFLKETAQGTFQLVSITVSNIGKEPQTLFDSNQKIIDDKGREFEPNSMAAMALDNNEDVWIKPINPGNSVKGVLVYDMPDGAVPVTIELHDSAFSGGVKVALK